MVAQRTIYAQPDRQATGQQLAVVAQSMQPRWPQAAELLTEAEEDILAYMTFPIVKSAKVLNSYEVLCLDAYLHANL